MSIPGRIYQDDNFDVVGFEGTEIEHILGLVDCQDSDDNPIVVNMKVVNRSWQRYFLDAFIGFWEDWGELTDEEDEDTRFVDYADKFKLIGKKIKNIKCRDGRIVTLFESGDELILELVDHKADDKYSVVYFSKSSA